MESKVTFPAHKSKSNKVKPTEAKRNLFPLNSISVRKLAIVALFKSP